MNSGRTLTGSFPAIAGTKEGRGSEDSRRRYSSDREEERSASRVGSTRSRKSGSLRRDGDGDGERTTSFGNQQASKALHPEDEDPWDPRTGLPWSVGSVTPLSSSATSKGALATATTGHRARIDSETLPSQPLLSPPAHALPPPAHARSRSRNRDVESSPERTFDSVYSSASSYSLSTSSYPLSSSPPQNYQVSPHHRHQSSTAMPLLQGQEGVEREERLQLEGRKHEENTEVRKEKNNEETKGRRSTSKSQTKHEETKEARTKRNERTNSPNPKTRYPPATKT